MLARLRRFVWPPDPALSEKQRSARLLRAILFIVFAFTLLLLVIYAFSPTNEVGLTLVVFGLVSEFASYRFLQAGKADLSARVLIFTLWALLTLSTLTTQGVRGTATLGQVLLMTMAGLLVGETLAVALAFMTISGNYIATMLESTGRIAIPDPVNLMTYWSVQSSYLLLALGLTLFFARGMRSNMSEVRDSEQTLKSRVDELRQAQAQLEMADQNLRRREAILEALRVASERLFRGKSFDESANQVLKDLGKATGVDRVYIFENSREPNGRMLTHQRYEWVAEGVHPEIDNPALQDLDLEEAGFGRWVALLENNMVVKGHVRDFPQSEKDLLTPQGILSLLIVPIFTSTGFWGFIGFDETKWERAWSPAEEDALRGAGGILGGAIERRRSEEALHESQQRYFGILQDQFDLICRYTPDGFLLFANQAYIRYYGLERAQIAGMSIWTQVLPERMEGLRAKIASLKVKDPVAVSQSLNLRADGVKRWIEWTERGIFDESGKLVEIQAVGRDIDEEVRLRKQLEESLIKTESLAMTDALTSILNRRAIMEHAEAEWQRAQREKRPLSLVILDLDRLKEINDTFGHLFGDQALTLVSALMRQGMRRYDWVGRWGGDEFLLVLPGTGTKEAFEVAERLRQRVRQTKLHIKHGQEIELHLSLGVAGHDLVGSDDLLSDLLAKADAALYEAKQGGRDQVRLAS